MSIVTRRLERDPLGRVFARLTAALEDACSAATEGQNPQLTVRRRKVLLHRITRLISKAMTLIELAATTIDGAGR